jgi:NADPH:quinone reductase
LDNDPHHQNLQQTSLITLGMPLADAILSATFISSVDRPMPYPSHTDCIEISRPGDPDVLTLATRALPELNDDQVLIQVAFAGINRPDVLQRTGAYPPPAGASDIPGLEVSGTIVAIGAAVSNLNVGDRVCALLSGGGYAKYAVADASLCLPIPETLSLAEAAGLPETFFTVWYNLVEKGELAAGDNVLIHGGSSGIGTTAIQIAQAFGATVYATAGSAEKCQLCEELGATKAFNYRTEDFAEVKKLSGAGVDIILDMVGGDYVQMNIKCAAPKARIINIAFLQGSKVQIDLMPVMLKQLVLTGSTLRSQPVADKARIAREVANNLLPLVAAGSLKVLVHSVFPLAQAAEAHALMESSQHIGKIILDCTV